jgi:Tol biopolymer transport system component
MERLQQIEEIFQEALLRDPSGREAYVREACHDDSELQREVLSLLANHEPASDSQPWAAAAAAKLIDSPASLEPGQSLGPYRIESFLAAGGMGEVYRATDIRLHRQVAIKVSSAHFGERFEREARVIASLNHPHICQLHDVGPNYLVMELVEGPTLADRIKQGALPLDEALVIARQIAEALEAAHEKGIVHRDLKPGNVKVTPEGVVKVLDFGLAKAAEESSATGNPSDSPTQTMTATRAGAILGTAAYMSPEQARGIAADKRSDIWSFGVVLYEMLTGRHLFHGETVSDTLAAVLKTDPDWKALPPETPAAIRRLLRRCLERDRKRRLRDIGDAVMEIDEAQAEPEAHAVTAASTPALRLFPWITAALLALALPAVWLLRPKPEERMLQLEVTAPPGLTFGTSNDYRRYAISPDGSKVAFVAISADGKRSLWVRPLHASEAVRLPGTEGAIGPFWDPTSRWIAFGANGKVQKIDVSGGQPQVLCDASVTLFEGTWNREGVILFSDSSRTIHRVPATGGAPSRVLPLNESQKEYGFAPMFMPDGRRFLYSSVARRIGLNLGSLDGNSRSLMIYPDSPGRYAQSRDGKAYLLFVRRDRLVAQPFDTGTAAVSGEAVTIAEPVRSFSASENGVLIFRRSRVRRAQLTWFGREGKPLGTAGDEGDISTPRISSDQKTVAFTQFDGMSEDVWLFDGERGNTTRFTSGPYTSVNPVWSPDGSRVAYTRRSNDCAAQPRSATLCAMVIERPASGIGKEAVLYHSAIMLYAQSWSRDGRWLVLAEASGSFYLLPMSAEASGGERKPIPFPESPAEGRHPSISPDGLWLLYSSTQTGSRDVFVESLPEQMGGPAAGARRRVSIAGGAQPTWRADGREIFYVAADGKMMSVSVGSGGASLTLGKPIPLFQTRLDFESIQRQPYDVSADGNRFLLAQPLEESASVPITLIDNWPELLKKGAGAP